MNTVWTLVTIIASVAAATGTVIGIYYNHKNKLEDRIKDLENQARHHDKFIEILENKALKALDEQFNQKELHG